MAAVRAQGEGASVDGVHVDAQGRGAEPMVVEGDGAGEVLGESVVSSAGIHTEGASNVSQVCSFCEDVLTGDASDPVGLGGKGVQGIPGEEGGRERGVERQQGKRVQECAGLEVDVCGVEARGDSLKLDAVTFGLVGFVGGHDGGKEAEEGHRAGIEGVVDVNSIDALERGEGSGVESRAAGDARNGEKAGLGVYLAVAADVVWDVHGTTASPDHAVGVAGLEQNLDVDGHGDSVRLEVVAQEVLGVDGEVGNEGGGGDGADGALR